MKNKLYLFIGFSLVLLSPYLVKANVDGALAYGVGTDTIPKVRYWDNGTGSWSVQVDAANLGAGATIYWVLVKAAPTRDEYIMVTRDANNDIIAQVNKSDCWGDGTTCGNVKIITTNTNPTIISRSFDVEYETLTGKAIIVFSDNTNDPKYITWDGVSWSTSASIGETLLSGVIEWIELTNRPNTDEIAAVFSDANDDLNAMVWNDNSWSCQPSAVLATDLQTTNYKKFDAAYEGNSGDLFIVSGFAGFADLRRYTKLAGSCTYIAINVTGYAEIGNLIDVSEPVSGTDLIVVAEAASSANDAHIGGWTGTANTAFGYNDQTIEAMAVARKEVAAGYLGISGKEGIWVTADSNARVISYQTFGLAGNAWSPAGQWATFSPTPSLTGDLANLELYKFPEENKIMLIFSDQASDLWAKTYDGTSWMNTEGGAALTLTLSTANYQNFDFAFRRFLDLSFEIQLPGQSSIPSSGTQPGTLTTPIEFNASAVTDLKIQPCVVGYGCASGYKQDTSTPIFTFKNTGNVAEQWNISLSKSLSSWEITLYGNTSLDSNLQPITTTGWIATNNILPGNSVQAWLWADFVNSPAGTVPDVYINHSSLKA